MVTAQHLRGDLLGVYLNDHLAGSTVGLELARRMAASAEPDSVLRGLVAEIAEDRSALLAIMATLGIRVRGYKVFAAWAGEKAGRLKLNGHLLSRSPLSSLEETEMLRLGVEGKASGWRTLRALASRDSRLDAGHLDQLLARADRQSSALETLRVSIAEQALTSSTD